MPSSAISSEEIVRLGKAIYQERIRAQVEPEHIGNYVVINVMTGDYELDETYLAASDRAAARYPDAPRFGIRVGYPTLGRIGPRRRVSGHADGQSRSPDILG